MENKTVPSNSVFLKIQLTEDDKVLWALLLEHAGAQLLKQKHFCVSVQHLLTNWKPTMCSCDEPSLKAALLRLGTGIHYDIKKLDGKGSCYGFFVLLESVCILNDSCHYCFSTRYKEYLFGLRCLVPIQKFLIEQRLTSQRLW